jgi:diguanylate cyclase (GGDEF)-like protein/PAS domain S-box-containing protein
VSSHKVIERLPHLSGILKAVRDSVVVTDLEGRITYWNEGAHEIFGYSPEEAIGRSSSFLYSIPDGAAAELEHDLGAILAGKNHFSEWQGVHKNGNRIWLDVLVTPLCAETGELTGLACVAKDITERRQAAEAHSRLTTILEAATDFIGMAQPDGKCLYMNQAGRRMVGLGPDEELKVVADYSPEWAARRYLDEAFTVAARDGVWEGEAAFLDPAGREIQVWQVIVAHRGEDGSVEHFSTIARDTTERNRFEEELRTLNATLKALVSSSPLAIVTTDISGQVKLWSQAAERIFGWKAEELVGKLPPIVPDDGWDEHWALHQRLLAGESFSGIEVCRRDKAGLPLNFRISAAPLRDQHGRIDGMVQFFEDINDRKRAESAIRRLASIPEQSPDPVVELDLAGNTLYLNQAARSRFPDLQALGSLHPVLASVAAILRRFRHGEKRSFSFEVTHEESVYHQMIYFVPDSPLVRVFLRDVTEQRKAKELLEHEDLHDRLTGLPNRSLFLRRLDEQILAVRSGGDEHFSVLVLNLDRFKIVNDSLGHAAGDQLLRSVAQRIAVCLDPGEMAARLSSDEFAVLLGGSRTVAPAPQRAESLRAAISRRIEISGQEIFPSVSIGIASGKNCNAGEGLLLDAHTAMYRAKAAGGGRHEVFDPAMARTSLQRLRLESDLRSAIEHGELEIHYQPIVRLIDGAVLAFEALLRWPHPERGMVPPSEFIPVAEEAGLIQPLSYWVLDQVCQRLRGWIGGNADLVMHVNLSSRLFSDPTLVERVRSALAEAGIEGKRLVLEITESVVMGNVDVASETLNRLKELGVGVAIDDFGTGYSSLAYLERFPIDSLKIDCCFVAKIGEPGESLEILNAIFALARNLGIEVIAEGVETERQLSELLALGCTLAQGYLFSRPVDLTTARRFLTDPLPWHGLAPFRRPVAVPQQYSGVEGLRGRSAS